MPESNFVKIEGISVNKNLVSFILSYSRNLERFFHKNFFYIKYDEPISNVKKDILMIPGLASLVTLCWATNSDLYFDEIDEGFLSCLPKIRKTLNNFYPKIGFNSNLIPNKITRNEFNNSGIGLLFSGGVDSTSIFFKNREKATQLFTIIGGVIPVSNKTFIKKYKKTYRKFAEDNRIKISFIETNLRKVLNEPLLTSMFHRLINARAQRNGWWEVVSHGLVQLSLCAPLTTNKIKTLIVSSSGTHKDTSPYGSHPYIDNQVGWGGTTVTHDGLDYNRQQKIKFFIKKHIHDTGNYPPLQVCNYKPFLHGGFNCGRCEKCLRTIIGLIVEGIDPVKCGLPIHRNIYEHIKKNIIPHVLLKDWERIQPHVDFEKIQIADLYESKEFLIWLKDQNLENLIKTSKIDIIQHFLYLSYSKLPRKIQEKALKKHYQLKYELSLSLPLT